MGVEVRFAGIASLSAWIQQLNWACKLGCSLFANENVLTVSATSMSAIRPVRACPGTITFAQRLSSVTAPCGHAARLLSRCGGGAIVVFQLCRICEDISSRRGAIAAWSNACHHSSRRPDCNPVRRHVILYHPFQRVHDRLRVFYTNLAVNGTK